MKNIQWLINLASRKPFMFSLALLLIAISTLAAVVANRDTKYDDCNHEKEVLRQYYETKCDSLSIYYRGRERDLNDQLKATLTGVIESYRTQLEEQQELNSRINSTIERNRTIIRKNSKTQNQQ